MTDNQKQGGDFRSEFSNAHEIPSLRAYLAERFGIRPRVFDLVELAEGESGDSFDALDRIMAYNQYKVLAAFQKYRISDMHFSWNTGYGYNDPGREALENVFAEVLGGEAALVRPAIVNGTHALTLTLQGLLRPGDHLIYCTGRPYDTLETVIGLRGEGMGSLMEFGIGYGQVELTKDGAIDFEALDRAITPKTRMVCLQRATGYGWRPAITLSQIAEWAEYMGKYHPDIIRMVDNCYGEFLDYQEPLDVGADIMAGSLIKNPGGGLALAGGYITGRKDLVERISYRMTAPGIGGECGLTFGQTRTMFQGLFLAPKVVNGAVRGAILCGRTYANLGFDVCPKPEDPRSDIIQGITLGSAERVVAFCKGIQAAAPVDAHVEPLPWDMPGYGDQVVMAAGAFVQGSSIELSADAPIRPPYNVYFQGGLTYEHSKFGVLRSLEELCRQGLVDLPAM